MDISISKPIYAFFIFTFISTSFIVEAKASNKPRVAVREAKVGAGIRKSVLPYLNLETLLASMEKALVSARKFEVLTRDKAKLKDIRGEQKFDQSSFTKGGTALEGGLETANFLIFPTIQDFKFYRSTKPVPNLTGKYTRQDSGMLEVAAQIIDTTTGGIKTTFYLKSTFGTKSRIVNSKGGSPNSVNFTNMANKVSAQMTDQLVALVFPMKVLAIQENQIFINRGQDGGLKKGDALNVYHPGVALIDTDTGENLGSAETLLGKIKVVRVNPKFTITEAKDKSLTGSIQVGDIVREP
jgi:Flagellar assembly protein T, C-terminal domain